MYKIAWCPLCEQGVGCDSKKINKHLNYTPIVQNAKRNGMTRQKALKKNLVCLLVHSTICTTNF